MSFCSCIFRRLLEAALLFLAITFIPGIPPNMTFTAYSVSEPRDLEGPLSINEKLNGAERLFEGEIWSPEGFAVANNTLYTGLGNGDIKKLKGNELVTVANIGHPCAGPWEEKICGRPLFMDFDKHGMLYVIDAYYGIYKVNVNTGKTMHLVSTDKPIEGKLAKIANSVTVAQDGTVYWTVSSCDVDLQDGLLAALGDPSGRLFKYDPIKKTHTLLMDKIHFTNGVALSSKEDFLVVSETIGHRLLRYWLSGPKKGTSEVFVDGLPGMPDNLRPNGKGGFFVPLIVPRTKNMPALSDLLAPYPMVRRFLARLLTISQLPFELIQRNFPNLYTGTVARWINNMEMFAPLTPHALIVVEVNEAGEIVGSLQSTDNKVTLVSDIVLIDGVYYLGSPTNKFLGRVKTNIQVKTMVPPPSAQS